MYKRRTRPKPGSLGIVRTSVTNQSNAYDKSEIGVGQTKLSDERDSLDSLSKETSQCDDADLVQSDSEPSPKKSKRFVNSSSVLNELSLTRLDDTGNKKGRQPLNKDKPTLSFSSIKNISSKDLNQDNTVNRHQQNKDSSLQSKIRSPSLKPVASQHAKSKTSQFSPIRTVTSQYGKSKSSSPMKSVASRFGKRNIKKKKGTYLEEIFEKSGLLLSDGSSPNVLQTDQAIFIRDITNTISQDEKELRRNVEQIMKDLEDYCNNELCFKYAVSCTETGSECEVSRGATQDSLMRLLLHVDCLQAPVTQLAMDKLAKFVMDGTSGESDTPVLTWVRMILQCFRFLNRMAESSSVNERLLDIILATSDVTIQQEVVIALPDIITDADHHHTALELSKLVRKSSPPLMASALEALTNLALQPDVRAQIQPILMKALQKAQPEFLPTILKFLLSESDSVLMDEIINFLRNELDLTEIQGDTASIQLLVLNTLRDALLASRLLPGVWQKNILSVNTQAEHKPIDIVMILVLLSTNYDPVRQKSIEGLVRKKIRSDMFTEQLINETLKGYTAVVKEYFTILTKLAGALLKSTEPAVVDFASKMYIGVFVNMDGSWCKWVLSELQLCVGAGDVNLARSALNTLQHLTDNYHQKVKPNGVILLFLLNKLSDLALSEVCQLMDVLCHIAYSEDDSSSLSNCSLLQDEINIVVQKQLASSQLSVLRSGVVGCVKSIKYIAVTTDESSESHSDPGESLTERGKKAVQLFELLLASTRNSVEAHGLALEQLSHLLLSGDSLDQSFIVKLSTLMRDNLQDAFLISPSDFVSKDDVIRSSLQFYLDEECDGAIALNLCELVSREMETSLPKAVMGVSCLHPLLRLLRGLEIKDLSEIDALLGCAIVMPVPVSYTDFSQLTAYQQHIALHCLFHCINWFCEIVNCFAYLIKSNQPEKVLIRLRTIVWMRGLLTRCLPLAMEYIPPTCHFQAMLKPKLNTSEKKKKATKKRGKKKEKKKQNKEESVLTGNVNTSQAADEDEEEEEEVAEEMTADLVKYKHYFRELDIDVWLILTQPLTLSPTPEQGGQFTAELGPNELLFLLDDYVTKLTRALTSSNKRLSFLKTTMNQNVGFENLDKFTPLHLAKNTLKLLPFLCGFLEKTMEYTQNLVKVNDGIFDSTGMFMDGSAEIKQCQGKLLKILAILFSWIGFQSQANSSFLIVGLQKLAGRLGSEQSKNKSKKMLVRECVQYLSQGHEHVLDLASACTLVDVIKAVVHHTDDDVSLDAGIASICVEFLKRRWYDLKGNREKGATLNSRVSDLLSGYLTHSEDKLAAVTTTLAWLATESQQLTEKDAVLTTFPAFSRVNVHLLIGGLLKGLEGAVKQKLDSQLSDREQLDLWSSFTQALETLVTVVKTHDSKPNLRVFMKGCTSVLRLFLSQGMSTCTFMFKHEPAVVSQILKKLQVATRYIQTICNFVKVSKDTGLTQFLPPIRAVLETILLRVKSIIVINNCTDAFFMGSMKNRDLKGQEIPSQETVVEGEEVEDSLQNEHNSESEKEEENPTNETDSEENEETGESVSILC